MSGLNLREAVTFGVIGLINTLIFFVVVWTLMRLGAGPYWANGVGHSIAVLNSFIMNRTFTFRSTAPAGQSFLRFLLTFLASYLVNLAVLHGGLLIDPTRVFLWQLPAMVGYTVTFFLLSKWFVFR